MSTWLDDGTIITRYVRALSVRTDNTRRLYRLELSAFQRFMMKRAIGTS